MQPNRLSRSNYRRISTRHLRLEPLEDRAMLSLTAADPTEVLFSYPKEGGEIEITLSCNDYTFETLEDSVEQLTAENMDSAGDSGAPELPYRLLRIALPADADLDSVRLAIETMAEETAAGTHDLAPAPVAYTYAEEADLAMASPFADETTTSTTLVLADPSQTIVDGRDVDIYAADAFLNTEYCTLLATQQMGRWKFAEVAYTPFSYNPVIDEVRVVTAGEITLTYETDSPLDADLLAATRWDADAADMFANFDYAFSWYAALPLPGESTDSIKGPAPETKDATSNFVIVTTADIVAGSGMLDHYVAMKEQLGWSVYVATESDWGGGTGNTAAENIRAWLQANYVSMGIEYVMLVGNPDPADGDVPMKMTYPTGSDADEDHLGPTDYYYADLTSNWNSDGDAYYGEWKSDIGSTPIHEVLVGRIPVYHPEYTTLDSILNKTMAYQSEDATEWRESLVMPMAVIVYAGQDSQSNWRRADGVGVAENLAGVAQAQGFDTFTLYEKEGLSPTPETCDLDLTRDNLVDHWSSNPAGLVTWTGHGSTTGVARLIWRDDANSNGTPETEEMSSPDFFRNSDAAKLDDTHPSIVFEASCNNAYPENPQNLASSLLANGAVGAFAATRVSMGLCDRYETYQDRYGYIQAYAFNVPAKLMEQPDTQTLGASLQSTRESLGYGESSWRNPVVFNLYGDPTVTLLNPTSTPGAVFGIVRDDANGDGFIQPMEAGGLPGATVFIDDNENGEFDFGERYTVSDSEGRYALGGLADGDYTISIAYPSEYRSSGTAAQTLTIAAGADALDVDFTAFRSGSVSGSVVVDLNGNGIRDAGETVLSDIVVTLDAPIDDYDATTLVGVDGLYSFTRLPQGEYTVSYALPPGYEAVDGTERIATLAEAGNITVDFPVSLTTDEAAVISGHCWYDTDANGEWETTSESGMNGVVVFLDLDGNGLFDETDPWARCGDDTEGNPGHYRFASLPGGRYRVGFVPLDGWTQTAPTLASYTFDLTVGFEETDVDFGLSLDDCSEILVSTSDDLDNDDLDFNDLSFREAIRIAEERPGRNIIRFAPALSGRTIELNPTLGTFVIASEVDIMGVPDLPQTSVVDERVTLDALDACTVLAVSENTIAAMSSLIITGGNANLEFDSEFVGGGIRIDAGATVTVDAFNISQNQSADTGGGIYNCGSITVTRSTISGNHASFGGGIFTEPTTDADTATVILRDSTISDNSAETRGGGVYSFSLGGTSNLIIYNSFLIGNSAGEQGGGIVNKGSLGPVVTTITNSVLDGNSSGGYGGAIYNTHYSSTTSVTVVNCTIARNSTTDCGGGVATVDYSDSPSVTMTCHNSVLAENTAQLGPDIYQYDGNGTISGSHNLIGDGSGQSVFANGIDGNLVGTIATPIDPMLDDDGTPLAGSPAIDAGSDANLPADEFDLDGDGDTAEPVPVDLMGNRRIMGECVDIGAVEYWVAFTLPGDLNDDGRVGSADLDIVRSNWGRNVDAGSLPDGDPSGDGLVGGADLDVIRSNWGAGVPAAGALDVAEHPRADEIPFGPRSQNGALPAGADTRVLAEAAWAEAFERLKERNKKQETAAVDLTLLDWA